MKLSSLRTDLLDIKNNNTLFLETEFNARKDALEFIALIKNLFLTSDSKFEIKSIYYEAIQLEKLIIDLNHKLYQKFLSRIQALDRLETLRTLLAPFTSYRSNKHGQAHYGYENIDGLLEGILTPYQKPEPTLNRDYGMVRYEPTPASVILELVDKINFTKNDVFYDLGSGLGKVVGLVNILTGVSCVGVEFEPSYYNYATQRAAFLNLDNIRYINSDARSTNYSDGTVFFLFNPFGGKIFETVFEILHQESFKRQITVCSYGTSTVPIAELPWLHIADQNFIHDFKLAIFKSKI
ncbi:MAG: hypothetical protein ABFS03_05465 [Chloroflexota bacterium]